MSTHTPNEPSRRRSRSPTPTQNEHHAHKRRRHHSRWRSPARQPVKALPFNAASLSKHDLTTHRPMFALYLDIQKQKYIEDLPEEEVRGRWKSFVGKWNRGELAEGWYDPATLRKAVDAAADGEGESMRPTIRESRAGQNRSRNGRPSSLQAHARGEEEGKSEEDDDSDDYGPLPPTSLTHVPAASNSTPSLNKQGPSIPNTSDLAHLRESALESASAARSASIADLKASRREERRLATQRLDDLAPRADAGSHARLLEKKREANFSNKSFAASAHESGNVDLREADVMGEEDSLGELKRMKRENERKKNERELRREENLRARRAEWEGKKRVRREREERTVEMLRGLVRERFG